MIYSKCGRFHAEQDSGWEPEMCPVTKKWSKTQRFLLNSWTIYEYGKFEENAPSYQTPRFFFPNYKAARAHMEEHYGILIFGSNDKATTVSATV